MDWEAILEHDATIVGAARQYSGGDYDLAQDIAQEIRIRLRKVNIPPDANVKNYVFGAAKNIAWDVTHSRYYRPRPLVPLEDWQIDNRRNAAPVAPDNAE